LPRGRPARVVVDRTQRYDKDGAAGDADEIRRDTAEERRLEGSAPARADHDQLGVLLVGKVGEPFRRESVMRPLFRLDDPLVDDDLRQKHLARVQLLFGCRGRDRVLAATGRKDPGLVT
jgi:hypothetical protein